VGDVNKDTFDEFVICATSFDNELSDVGACYLIYGGNNLQSTAMNNLGNGGIRITGSTTSQMLGFAVAAAGDINKDGYADILISCTDRVNVYLLYGGPSLTNLDTTAGSFPGVIFPNPTSTSDKFGNSVSRAGDFNGGYDDLIIGSPSTTTSSQIFVVFGGSSLPAIFDLNTRTSTTGVRYFTAKGDDGGYSVSGGVDYNRDGFDDIIIGADLAMNSRGAAHVVFGSASPMDSSVFHLGNGVISLNGALLQFGSVVTLEKNVGTNTRGILVFSGGATSVFYFHDLFLPTPPTLSPTFPPTVAPSGNPSESSSVFPTIEPSVSRTFTPTFTPTRSPSVVPSESPTVTPTQIPTLFPSVDLTMTPSEVPTTVPSFRPSAPTYSPSAVPTPIPTARSKSAVIINAGFTMNSVTGATLTPTSQETIKQSIANASQTTVNNVDLVSVTRTNRRLLLSSSSVVRRMFSNCFSV
jgi:hypothetical protein